MAASNIDKPRKEAIKEVICTLGAPGMSEDETDPEQDIIPKIVRRAKHEWLSDEVSMLMHSVETYGTFAQASRLYDSRGNKPLKRLLHNSPLKKGKPITGLPMNWYDASFYRRLMDYEKRKLGAAPFKAIPVLVSSCSLSRLLYALNSH